MKLHLSIYSSSENLSQPQRLRRTPPVDVAPLTSPRLSNILSLSLLSHRSDAILTGTASKNCPQISSLESAVDVLRLLQGLFLNLNKTLYFCPQVLLGLYG